MFKKKHPSPDVNPATQKGCGIFCARTSDLAIGFIFGNATCNFLDKPIFIDAFIATIFSNPSLVRFSLRCIKVTTSRNSK